MKIKYEFAISEGAGETVAVSVGAEGRNMVIGLNNTALVLWKLLTEGADIDAMIAAMLENFEGIDEENARADAEEFVRLLRDNDLLAE